MRQLVRGIAWFVAYVLLIVAPGMVAIATDPFRTPRPDLVEFSVAVGLLAFSLVLVQFALVSRVRAASRPFGTDALVQFHRYMGFLALGFVLLHPMLLNVTGMSWAAWVPVSGPAVAQTGAVALWAIVGLVITTVMRQRLGLSYEAWRGIHLALSMLAAAAMGAHVVAAGGYSRTPPMRGLLATYVLMFGAALVTYRVIRPLSRRSRPWIVSSNMDLGGQVHHLRVKPVGHPGFAFDPGQFAWLTTGASPFSSQQHPLSISSSAERPADGSIEFSIRALGDWSSDVIPTLAAGTRVWVDGAFGAFTTERKAAQGFVFIAGGTGIVPMRSMLLTMRDRGDRRHAILIYAARDPSRMPFRLELMNLRHEMSLDIVEVLEAPPEGWTGERGYVTRDLLQRHLPAQFRRYHHFVCGPPEMMDTVEANLVELGVPSASIDSERFNVV